MHKSVFQRSTYYLYLISLVAVLGPLTQTGYATLLQPVSHSFAISLTLVGSTATAYTLVVAAGRYLSGPLIDRWGRWGVLMGALVTYLVGSILICLAPSVTIFVAGLMVQAAGVSAFSILAGAIVGDLFDTQRRARAMGVYTLLTASLGPSLGPVLAGSLTNRYTWNAFFVVLAGAALVLTLQTLWSLARLPVTLPAPRPTGGPALGIRPLLHRTILGMGLVSGIQFYLQLLLVAYIPVAFSAHYSAAHTGWMVAGVAVVTGLVSPWGGGMADRVGRLKVIRVSLGVMVASLYSMAALVGAFEAPPWWAISPLLLFFAALGVSLPAQLALVVEAMPEAKATALGTYNLLRFGIGSLGPATLAPLLSSSLTIPLWTGGTLTVLAFAIASIQQPATQLSE